MQRKIVLAVLLMCFSLAELFAQNAVLASGGDGSGTGGSVAYSVGQTNYVNYTGEDGSISLGVQQPYLIIMVGADEPDINLSAGVYPNPVNTSVNLSIEEKNSQTVLNNLSLDLYDMNGKLLLRQKILTQLTSISMEALTNAMYILRITKNNAEIKTFKIFKTN